MLKRILSLLIALGLMFSFAVKAFAADIPDLTQMKGSLVFTMDVDGVPLNSGSLNAYQVAEVISGTEGFEYRLVQELADAGAVLDTADLHSSAQAESLLEVSRRVLTDCLTSSIVNGGASFTELDAGLYLVWQDADDACDGYTAISPFLISIPQRVNDAYIMHVEADPKVPFEPTTTEPPPPTPPPPPYVPQTGQLNGPVPVMAIAGVTLFVAGWIMCLRKKRIDNEG